MVIEYTHFQTLSHWSRAVSDRLTGHAIFCIQPVSQSESTKSYGGHTNFSVPPFHNIVKR